MPSTIGCRRCCSRPGSTPSRMAKAGGIASPAAAALKQLDRQRKGKRLRHAEGASPTDRAARITRMQDGRTRLACKPAHAVDPDTEAIVAAEIHPADQGDTTTLAGTLEAAARGLDAAGRAPTPRPDDRQPHRAGRRQGRSQPRRPEGFRRWYPWQTRIAEPKPRSCSAGVVTSRLAPRRTAIGADCAPASANKPSSGAPNGSRALRAQPRSWRPAPGRATGPGERPPTLSRASRGLAEVALPRALSAEILQAMGSPTRLSFGDVSR
jgi:hypothetical protein